MKIRPMTALIMFALFIGGSLYIVLAGRPVVSLSTDNQNLPIETPENDNTGSAQPEPGLYTLSDVNLHDRQEDCWTVINDSVYDLTSFVSRHPGGVKNIIRLCGIDGTELFTQKHGNSRLAQSALALLKIGNLK